MLFNSRSENVCKLLYLIVMKFCMDYVSHCIQTHLLVFVVVVFFWVLVFVHLYENHWLNYIFNTWNQVSWISVQIRFRVKFQQVLAFFSCGNWYFFISLFPTITKLISRFFERKRVTSNYFNVMVSLFFWPEKLSLMKYMTKFVLYLFTALY